MIIERKIDRSIEQTILNSRVYCMNVVVVVVVVVVLNSVQDFIGKSNRLHKRLYAHF